MISSDVGWKFVE